MPHLSRILAVTCAIAVTLFSLPTDAGIGDKDLPLLDGKKAKLLYTVVGVTDYGGIGTSFHCTSTEPTGGKTIEVGIELFDFSGALVNDVSLGDGKGSLSPGATFTVATRFIALFFANSILNTGTLVQGSARIIATSKNLLCFAILADAANTPPTSMVMLPVFRATKQSGM